MTKRSCLRLLLAATLLTGQASAHYLWLEPTPAGSARLFFGEYQEDLREKTGGRLDEMPAPWARALVFGGAERELPSVRRADHVEFGPATKATGFIAGESGYPVKDWRAHGHGVVKPVYYARLASLPGADKPRLTLDVLPVAPGVVGIYFREQPLARAKVMVYAPNRWMREYQADERGQATIDTPWPGQYVIEVVHREAAPGEFEGRAYEALRHRATLTLRVNENAR